MIARQNLPYEIANFVESQIVRGKRMPGEPIVESRLAKELGISQTPVREALRLLGERGLVEHSSNRGSRVAAPTKKEAGDALALMQHLEVFALDLARSTATDSSEVREALEALERAKEDPEALHEAHFRFHATLWALAANEELSRVLERLFYKLFLHSKFDISPVDEPRDVASHQRMVDFVFDPTAARAPASRSGRELVEVLRSSISEEPTNTDIGAEAAPSVAPQPGRQYSRRFYPSAREGFQDRSLGVRPILNPGTNWGRES